MPGPTGAGGRATEAGAISVVATAYGRAALERLRQVVDRAKAGDPLAPVTVVVPSNHVGVTARRALARDAAGPRTTPGRGTIGVAFLTPYRLAELLGAPRLAADGRRPVSTPVVAAALRQALRQRPGVFAPVAEHPATEEALVGTFAELSDLSAGALDRLAATGPRAADVVDVCRRARERLSDGWYDESDLLAAARQALAADVPGRVGRTAPLGHVIVHLPQDLTRGSAALLRQVARWCPTTVIVGLTGHPRADAGVHRSLSRLGVPSPPLAPSPPPAPSAPPARSSPVPSSSASPAAPASQRAASPSAPSPAAEGPIQLSLLDMVPPAAPPVPDEVPPPRRAAWPVSAGATRIVSTSDADDEVRAAVRAVLDEVRRGTPLERIAVLYAADEPYARLVHEHLRGAGIPVNGTAVQGLAGRVLGRAYLDLLALRDHRYRRRDVLGLLATLPLRLTGGGAGSAAEWERLSRQAAVVTGRDHWDRRLAQLAEEIERRAGEAERRTDGLERSPADPPNPADTAEPNESAVALATPDPQEPAGSTELSGVAAPPEVEEDPGEAVEEREGARSVRLRRRAERARRLREEVVGLIDEIERAAAEPQTWRARVEWLRGLVRSLLGGEPARARWPEDERKAAERVEAALDRLAALDEIDGPADLDVFRRTLELELDADLGRVGRFGEGVLVAPLSFAVGVELDLVVVLGAAEGTLPVRLSEDSLLPDRERRVTGGELPLRHERLDRQQRQLHAALAAAHRHVLGVPRGDLRASNERVPSRWVAEMVAGDEPPVLEQVPSFAHAVTHVPFPATEQEYRLRAASLDPPLVIPDPIVTAGRALQRGRRSRSFTRFDGNLAGQPVRSPLDDVVSATRLETWATCPHAYFVRQVLRVEPTDDPADLLWISPIDRGSLVHQVLERFLRTVLDRPADAQPDPDEPWSGDDHDLLQEIGQATCAEYEARGVVGRSLFWERDRARILGRLDRFLHEDSTRRRATRSRPVAAELDFGLPGSEVGPVDFPIAGGRTLQFRGAADRVDVTEDGTLRVIDYKTGRPYDYRSLSEENPDDRGTHLQLAVYGVAARAHRGMPEAPVVAEYWFVTESGQLSQAGYPVTDDVLARVGETLGVIVDGIERGAFPARPTGSSSDPFVRCRYCDPDGLGTTDRRRQWERKRHDPAVTPYARLAEPDVEVAG